MLSLFSFLPPSIRVFCSPGDLHVRDLDDGPAADPPVFLKEEERVEVRVFFC